MLNAIALQTGQAKCPSFKLPHRRPHHRQKSQQKEIVVQHEPDITGGRTLQSRNRLLRIAPGHRTSSSWFGACETVLSFGQTCQLPPLTIMAQIVSLPDLYQLHYIGIRLHGLPLPPVYVTTDQAYQNEHDPTPSLTDLNSRLKCPAPENTPETAWRERHQNLFRLSCRT